MAGLCTTWAAQRGRRGGGGEEGDWRRESCRPVRRSGCCQSQSLIPSRSCLADNIISRFGTCISTAPARHHLTYSI